jgi:hypothetical protein
MPPLFYINKIEEKGINTAHKVIVNAFFAHSAVGQGKGNLLIFFLIKL